MVPMLCMLKGFVCAECGDQLLPGLVCKGVAASRSAHTRGGHGHLASLCASAGGALQAGEPTAPSPQSTSTLSGHWALHILYLTVAAKHCLLKPSQEKPPISNPCRLQCLPLAH